MEKQFPKNVKQIGNVSDSPKIYLEDYADTFLNQLCDNQGEEPVGALLIGEQAEVDGQPCVYIYGAVRLADVPMDGTSPRLTEEVLKAAKEDKEKYFPAGEMIGWFLSLPGQTAELNENIRKIHEKTFPKTNTVFIAKDTVAKEEMFFAYKYHDLMEIGGHYIYYEKNPSMQEYMVSTRKENGVTPSEVVTDRAAKDFRSLVRDRMEKQEKKKGGRLTYAAGMAVAIVALVIGVTFFNNYDKLRSVKQSLPVFSASVEGKTEAAGKDAAGADGQTADGQAVDGQTAAGTDGQTAAGAEGTDEQAAENPEGQAAEETVIQAVEGAEEQSPEGQAADAATSNPPETIVQTDMGEGDEGEQAAGYTDADFYVVRKGDTLAKISKKLYGNTGHVEALCKMNGLEDGNLIFIGQKLLLP